MSTVNPTKLSDIRDRNVVVWGTGREGAAAAHTVLFGSSPASLVVVDDAPEGGATFNVGGLEVPVVRGDGLAEALQRADIIVKSPGVPRYRPELLAAIERGAVVTGGTALWLAERNGANVVAITGTKGKSTTTSLVAYFMASLNIPVLAAGNIGVPVISLFDNPPSPDTVCVLETSSYQAADVEVSPDIGVLTSLFPEHLNWHGDLQRYYADKRNLFVHRTDAVTVVSATGGDAPLVGRDLPGTVKWFDSPETLHVQDTRIVRGDSLVLDASASPLLGAHNLSNLAGTLTVLEAYGIDLVANRAALENALAAFSPLPHRLERIATAGGVQFVDDGLATNPHAAIAAIQSFPGLFVTLLVGGQDRGVDYTPLVDALLDRAEPTAVVGIPDNGNRVVSELRARADSRGLKVTEHLYDEDSLESAVRRAAGITPAGGVVLLAPAAPSFGRFRDYLERSAVFLQAVADL